MQCKVCGKELEHLNEGICPFCGGREFEEKHTDNQVNTASSLQSDYQEKHHVSPPERINQTPYLVFAILVTVFCCIPLGIPAIVYATKIDTLQACGNYEGAKESARKAKIFTISSAVIAAVVVIVYVVFSFAILDLFADLAGSYGSYY